MAGGGRFGHAAAARYSPCAGVHATRECDTVVRMAASPHGSLHEALTGASSPALCLATPSELGPHVWLEASMALDAVLFNAGNMNTSEAMLREYSAALEASTSNVDHEFLAQPVLSILGVWVGEQDIMAHLESISPHPLGSMAHVSTGPSLDLPSPVRVLLVARANSRQDDSALLDARASVSDRLGTDAAVVLRLGAGVEKEDSESLDSVMAALQAAALSSLANRLRIVTEEADKARRAARPSFKSWFGVSSAPKTSGLSSSLSSRLSYVASGSNSLLGASRGPDVGGDASDHSVSSTTSSAISGRGLSHSGSGSHHRRRNSSMNGVVATPLFPPDSVESLSRHTADLHLLSGDYEAAGDAYRVLATDLSGLSGPGVVHEASAIEHASVALALADGSKREVGGGFERAVRLYAKAGRRELAVRAALRAAEYCLDAGFPDSAAGVLDRALSVTFPNVTSSRVPAVTGSFSESAAAVLLGRTAFMFGKQGLLRKTSLYAYMAAMKLSNQSFHTAAARFAEDIDRCALLWPGIRDEVDLLLGRAAIAKGQPERAISLFSGVMSAASDSTDVEVQSRAILGFFEAISAQSSSPKTSRWDQGAVFPAVDSSEVGVETVDTRGGGDGASGKSRSGFDSVSRRVSFGDAESDAEAGGGSEPGLGNSDIESAEAWRSLEDDVLEDWTYFESLSIARANGRPLPKRGRSVDATVQRLRREKERGSANDPGGSLEMKIQRMREAAETARRKRRAGSLLDGGAVVGEEISLVVSLYNPLQFPVFVENMSAVVTLDGELAVSSVEGESPSSGDAAGNEYVSLLPVGDIVVMPVSSASVSLGVVVCKPGRLRFVGARWMFSVGRSTSSENETCSAPGFCALDRKGPRLNTTRKQRASEVPLYAQDTALTVEVIPPAPRLETRFVESSAEAVRAASTGVNAFTLSSGGEVSLRAGQKLRTSVILRNIGKEAIDRLVYRTGTPHALFLDAESCGDGTSFEAIEEEGSHAALVRPARVAGCLSRHLAPGEELQVPVWLFGSTGGEAEVRVVVAYGVSKVRVCRLECGLVVRPSVSVFPRFIRRLVPDALRESGSSSADFDFGLRSPRAYVLGIEVEHSGKAARDDSFHVDCISVTSSVGWRVQALPSPRIPAGCEVLMNSSANTALRINETATVFVALAYPEIADREDACSLYTSSIPVGLGSSPVLNGCGMDDRCARDRSDPESADVSCDGRSSSSGSRASNHFLLTAGHAKKTPCTSRDAVYATVKWRSSAGDVGELYLPPVDPGDWVDLDSGRLAREAPLTLESYNESIPGKGALNDNIGEFEEPRVPVAMRVSHEPCVSHSFLSSFGGRSASVPAVVPVNLYVRNMSTVLIDATVSAPVAGGIADGDRGRFWAGFVDGTLRAIPPGVERHVCLSAVLDGPGSFDLAKLVTSVRRHRGLGAPGSQIPALRAVSGDVRVDEVDPSNVVVYDATSNADDVPVLSNPVSEQGRGLEDDQIRPSSPQSLLRVPESEAVLKNREPSRASKKPDLSGDSAWDETSSSSDNDG